MCYLATSLGVLHHCRDVFLIDADHFGLKSGQFLLLQLVPRIQLLFRPDVVFPAREPRALSLQGNSRIEPNGNTLFDSLRIVRMSAPKNLLTMTAT
jgi:hypothetical protein